MQVKGHFQYQSGHLMLLFPLIGNDNQWESFIKPVQSSDSLLKITSSAQGTVIAIKLMPYDHKGIQNLIIGMVNLFAVLGK